MDLGASIHNSEHYGKHISRSRLLALVGRASTRGTGQQCSGYFFHGPGRVAHDGLGGSRTARQQIVGCDCGFSPRMV
jgi:hypothetical protein